MAASGAALLGVILTLAVTMTVLFRLPLEELGVRNDVSLAQILLILAAVAPMALIAPALQMFVSCFAKTFKESQGYLGLLMILPTIPGIVIMFYPLTNRPWLHPLPILGQYAMVSEILGGKDLPALSLAGAVATAALLAALLLALATRLLSSEKIIFGR